MPAFKRFISLATLFATFLQLTTCTSSSVSTTTIGKPVKVNNPKFTSFSLPASDSVVTIKVKPDPCSLQYVSVKLPTTGSFDHSPSDDGTFESNIRYGEDGGSMEEATPPPSSFFKSGNSIFSEDNSNSNSFLVYPTSVRVPLCTGACGRTGLEARLHICQPTGRVIKEVVQVAQLITLSSTNDDQTASSFPNFFNSSVRMGSRKLKVLLHTGCKCACRSNIEETCPLASVQRFNRDRCRCECINHDAGCAGRRVPRLGAMFWDETACQCRCPQYFSSYVRLVPPPKHLCPMANSSLDPVSCQCVASRQPKKTKKV